MRPFLFVLAPVAGRHARRGLSLFWPCYPSMDSIHNAGFGYGQDVYPFFATHALAHPSTTLYKMVTPAIAPTRVNRMTGQNEAETLVTAATAEQDAQRQRSSIGFPYMDLDDALDVARAIQNNVGHGDCEEDQLAAWLKLSPKSSGFRVRLYAARMFGVIETGGGDKYRLTQLGRAAVDPSQVRAAKVQAFLNVPLYRAVYDKYKGGVIPPAAAFERDIVGLGVSEKQKGRARQVLERAAEQAGYFEQGKDRLVKPGLADAASATGAQPDKGGSGGGGSSGGSSGGGGEEPPTDRHALIEALVDVLPRPGKEFSIDDLADWLRAAEVNLRIIYRIKGRINIDVEASHTK